MTNRNHECLSLVDTFYPDHDAVITAQNSEVESFGTSDSDLRCGEDGELLLRNYTVKQAQDHFRLENTRVVIKCPSCGRYNLLAAAVEKMSDGSVVTYPRGE